jgi:tRNA A37 methylthiotransferase MiaB
MHQAQPWRLSVMEMNQRAAAAAAAQREERLQSLKNINHFSPDNTKAKKDSFQQFCCIKEGCNGNCYTLRVRNVKIHPH